MLIGLKIAADKSEGFGTFKPSALQMLTVIPIARTV